MAADDYNPVSLRQKSKKKSRGGNVTMSRRRVSVKELGHPDHQGWLYRKKEGKGFLGIKWKKYWFVLKKQSLYWYTNHMSEKAEGFINLTDFMIDRAIECKKKYAIKACHPQVMMFYFAAESHEDMNVWLNKLGLASIQYESSDRNAVAECYSEASDHEDGETTDAPPPYCEQTILGVAALADSGHQEDTLPPPYTSPLPSEANGSLSSPVSTMTSQSSASSLAKHRQSWLDLVSQAAPAAGGGGETTVVCVSAQVHTHQHHHQQQQPPQEEEDETQALLQESPPATQDPSSSSSSEPPKAREQPPAAEGQTHVEGSDTNEGDGDSCSDEMERLYNHLKQASLSPIGDRKPSTKRDFRASFIKRCKNHTINDKLHLIRTLNSTLKSKETDLQALEQVLSDPELTSDRFREWKEANSPLHQEICFKYGQQGAAEELPATTTTAAEAMAAPVVETSL